MLAQQLGFRTSWRMLTRDKGWIKPVLVLTLVSWIPIVGQIAVLGYGLEWARLTAWGVDAAPKQRGVDYMKMLTTGGIAFVVGILMNIVVVLAEVLLFGPVALTMVLPLGLLSTILDGGASVAIAGGAGFFGWLAFTVLNVLLGTFVSAATMRATLYDGFGAAWRVDRLFQMVTRDFGGFLHTYVVSLIGDIAVGVVSGLLAFVGTFLALGGVLGALAGAGAVHAGEIDLVAFLSYAGALPTLLFVLLVLVAVFAVNALRTAMQLVAINAMGQWFCRFEVHRWGVSSAPLPDDVPRGRGTSPSAPSTPATPTMPADGGARDDAHAQHAASAGATTAPAQPASQVTAADGATSQPAPPASAAQPVEPASASQPVVTPVPESSVSEATPSTSQPVVPEADASAPAPPAVEAPSSADAEAPVPSEDEPAAEKKPIPLGPITSHDDEGDDGPISV